MRHNRQDDLFSQEKCVSQRCVKKASLTLVLGWVLTVLMRVQLVGR